MRVVKVGLSNTQTDATMGNNKLRQRLPRITLPNINRHGLDNNRYGFIV